MNKITEDQLMQKSERLESIEKQISENDKAIGYMDALLDACDVLYKHNIPSEIVFEVLRLKRNKQ